MREGNAAGSVDSDLMTLGEIEHFLVNAGGGRARFCSSLGQVFRRALDEVIDTPRTQRRMLDELEKTEKTYLGTKVEILLRNVLKLPKGQRLDLRAGDRDVDVKFTIHSN